MNANAINAATTALPCATGPGGANAAGQAKGPAAGFEALLAALFPNEGPLVAGAAPLAATGATTDPLAVDTNEEAGPKVEPDILVDPDAVTIADPNTALAASLAATPTAAVVAAPTTTTAPTETVKGARPQAAAAHPAFATNTHQNPTAPAKGKTELAPDAADGDVAVVDSALEDASHGKAEGKGQAKTDKPAPPAWGRDKPAGQPAAPALANANAKTELANRADVAAPAGQTPATEAPILEATAPDATATTASTASPVIAADLTAPEIARTAAPAPKSAKTERAKATSEAAPAGDLKAPAAADKPVTAQAVTPAAKPTSGETEVADATADAAKPSPDQPDVAAGGETHGPSQNASPVAHAVHAVRGAPETVANLAAQIVKKLEGKSTHFDVELNPAGLGKVNVRIDIGAQGAITAAMSFDNPQAAAELRSRAAELQRHLEQAGFNLTGGVTFDVAQDRGHHGQPWQHAQQDGNNTGRAFRGQAFQSALDTAGDAADAAVAGALRLRRGVTAGLDVRI